MVTFHLKTQMLNLIHLQEKVTHSFLQVFLPVCVLSSPSSPFFSLHLSVIPAFVSLLLLAPAGTSYRPLICR